MRGLSLAKLFYEQYGSKMIREHFAEYESRIAVGLCGHGSECFGYDDAISSDHDYDAGFCLWLTDRDYRDIGFALERAYASLPKEFRGVSLRAESIGGAGSKGVMTISDFYRRYTGAGIPKTNREWLFTPSFSLSEATNGEVFRDDLGEFSRIREILLNGMPEDVRIKKISANLALMAQSGQYNFGRCLKHGERAAAAMAINIFVKSGLEVIFLINHRYIPYYKWSFHALRELERLSELGDALEYLICAGDSADEIGIKQMMIEQICGKVAEVLVNDGICDSCGEYLEPYAYSALKRIKDVDLRNMHVMEGAAE